MIYRFIMYFYDLNMCVFDEIIIYVIVTYVIDYNFELRILINKNNTITYTLIIYYDHKLSLFIVL